MHHEIIGPETIMRPGFNGFTKNEAIIRHIAQYSTPSMFASGSIHESKQDQEARLKADQILVRLEALELTDANFFSEKEIRQDLIGLGVPDALINNWRDRRKVIRLQQLQIRAQKNNCTISIPSIEKLDGNVLVLEMNAMLKVLDLPETVKRAILDMK